METPLTRRNFLALSGGALVALRAPAAQAIVERPVSLVIWQGQGAFFGGFSGIELSTDRTRALAVSDRGFAVRAQLIRNARGRLTGVEHLEHFSLRDNNDQPLQTRRRDVEGMDQQPDGTVHLSFEGGRRTRVMRHETARARGRGLPRHDDWQSLPGNLGLEALAVDAGGRVFTIPENASNGAFPIYRLDGQSWSVIARLPNDSRFVPVGADFGPDGNLYLLERKFRMAFFATRISRLRPGNWGQREVLVETNYGVLDNHEGISVTRDGRGQLWATTISDDNQNRLQRTELAEFRLPPA